MLDNYIDSYETLQIQAWNQSQAEDPFKAYLLVREGVNKKIDYLGDLFPELWPPTPLGDKKKKQVDCFALFFNNRS